jgi:vitamin B12 transporter
MFCVRIEAVRLRASRSAVQSLKFSVVSAMLSSVPAQAQDASTTSPPTTLPPIVVTTPAVKNAKKPKKATPASQNNTRAAATNLDGNGQTPVISPTTVSTPVNEVPNSITVITSADLQQDQRRTVPDALQAVPGLNIVQSGGPGGQTSVFMRGANSNHVKVLIDGIDVSDPSNPNNSFDFGQLLTGDIERIEVLRGPQSGLYGSDAIGGVISIITKKGDGPPKAYASAEAGSFGTFNQATGVSGSTPGFNYAFNISHFSATNVPVTPLDLLPPGRGRIDDSYDNITYSTKLGADLSKSVSINFVARYTDATLHFTGDDFSVFPSVPAASQSTQHTEQFYTRGEAVWSLFDGRFKNYFGLGYANDWTLNLTPGSNPSVNQGERFKYDWRGVTQLADGQTLLVGVERQNEQLNADATFARTGDTAGFVELQSNFEKRFFLVSNIRYDDNDSFGGHETWRIAPAYIVPDTGTKLKASYGTGFKAPTLSQLYVNFPAFGFFGNPNLKPEESSGYDVGFEQPIANDRFRFGATYFHNDITNLINSNATFTSYTNVGLAETYGVESFASFAVTPQFKIRADYTYTIARDEITGDELLRRPKNKVTITSAWNATDELTLSSTIIYVGSWADISRDGSSNLTAPSYTTVNLAANYVVDKNLTVFGRIDNLFNVQYQDPTGFLRPGFGVFAGLRVNADLANLTGELK